MMDVDESNSSQKERDSTIAPARCTVSDASTTDTIEALLARVENLEKAIIETTVASQNPMNENDEPRSTLPLTIHDNRAKSGLYDTFELPESTFTLLITQPFLSIQFLTGLLACALALFCLILVLIDEVDQGTDDNPFGLPAGVTTPTRIAQYLGILIGVLMEEEIPAALEIIGKGMKQDISQGKVFSMKRILFSSMLRLTVGYCFLVTLFMTVVQESEVLGIFFDVLALEFVENIDDAVYELCKRGFFGRVLKDATRSEHVFNCKTNTSEDKRFRTWVNRFIRLVYFLNVILLLGWLTILVVRQDDGLYRCKSFSVQFGDDTWDESWIKLENGALEKRLLVYSHFNGIYVENGTHDGKPRYVEQNKERGRPFQSTIPAEIVYCQDSESWVFRHEYILTDITNDGLQNECDWLLTSPQTESYDLIELSNENSWSMWKGVVEKRYEVTITCNECHDPTDCNYHGSCINQRCECAEGFFGISCKHAGPCNNLLSSKDNTTLSIMKDLKDPQASFVEVYNRPLYITRNMTQKPIGLMRYGYPPDEETMTATTNSSVSELSHYHAENNFDDDDFFQINNSTPSFQKLLTNYTFILWYSGRRWLGQLFSPEITAETFAEEEFHAFWWNSLSGVGYQDNETLIISEPSTDGTPEGIKFYEMRRRNLPESESAGYGPFGVLIPLINAQGASFFSCLDQVEDDADEL